MTRTFLAFGLAWCLLMGLLVAWLALASGGSIWWWVPTIVGLYGGQLGRVLWDRLHQ